MTTRQAHGLRSQRWYRQVAHQSARPTEVVSLVDGLSVKAAFAAAEIAVAVGTALVVVDTGNTAVVVAMVATVVVMAADSVVVA